MSNMNPRYSIIIPTFERGNLLRGTIKGCLLQEYDDFELLISNNFSKDNTKLVLAEFADHPKVRIIQTERKLSMQDHWAFAMDHAKGEYILFLGDDDGVSPRLFKILDKVIRETNANIVKFRTALYYHNDWNGIEKNTFHFNSGSSGNFFNVNIDYVIQSFCDFADYKYFPSLLTCVFKRDLYLSAHRVVHQMFVGAPDHSCSFLLLAQPEASLCFMDMVLGYGGRSENSNSAFYAAKEKKSNKKKARHIEWSTEMSDETRLPHHKPDINTPGNFLPAAFSYAKFFFPERFSSFQLDRLELCKVIQRDLVNCLIGRRPGWHTFRELDNFNEFIASHLGEAEKKVVFNLGSRHSLAGRVRLLVKRAYLLLSDLLIRLNLFNIELYRARAAERRAFDIRIDLSSEGIPTSYELMKHFDRLIRSVQVSQDGSSLFSRNQNVILMGRIGAL